MRGGRGGGEGGGVLTNLKERSEKMGD